MNILTQLSSKQLDLLKKLITAREKTVADLEKIDAELNRIAGGSIPATATKGRRGRPKGSAPTAPTVIKAPKAGKTRKARKTRPRGEMKTKILELMKEASSEGISVTELSAKIGAPKNNVYTWIYTTGRKISGIKKLKNGNYTFKGELAAEAAA